MFGRRATPTQTRLMLDELAQSYMHLRNAAGHAAGGTAEALTPGYDRARAAASRRFTSGNSGSPMADQWRAGARNARGSFGPYGGGYGGRGDSGRTNGGRGNGGGAFGGGRAGKRGSDENGGSTFRTVARLLMAGAAVGGATAIVVKRRRQANQWEEYEPIPEVDDYGQRYGQSARGNFAEQASKLSHGGASLGDKAASLAHAVQGKASQLANQLHERASRQPTDEELRPGGPGPSSGGGGASYGGSSMGGSGMGGSSMGGSGMGGSGMGQGGYGSGSRPQETTTFSGFAEGLDDDLGTHQ